MNEDCNKWSKLPVWVLRWFKPELMLKSRKLFSRYVENSAMRTAEGGDSQIEQSSAGFEVPGSQLRPRSNSPRAEDCNKFYLSTCCAERFICSRR